MLSYYYSATKHIIVNIIYIMNFIMFELTNFVFQLWKFVIRVRTSISKSFVLRRMFVFGCNIHFDIHAIILKSPVDLFYFNHRSFDAMALYHKNIVCIIVIFSKRSKLKDWGWVCKNKQGYCWMFGLCVIILKRCHSTMFFFFFFISL